MPLEARKISYRYPQEPWLFHQFDLTIQPGESVGLVGPSGSGKTTLGRVLAGYDEPELGEVCVTEDTSRKSRSWKLGKKTRANPVQMIFQHPERAVNPYWTVRSILREAWQPDEADLRSWGIDPSWLNRRSAELSGGELQRVCILRAMGPSTRYVIADEMTTMLDGLTQAKLWHTMLKECRERQIGLLVISHDMHLVHRVCDHVMSL